MSSLCTILNLCIILLFIYMTGAQDLKINKHWQQIFDKISYLQKVDKAPLRRTESILDMFRRSDTFSKARRRLTIMQRENDIYILNIINSLTADDQDRPNSETIDDDDEAPNIDTEYQINLLTESRKILRDSQDLD